ncbi:MAG TPA: NAD(+) synthase, partial [Agriterribacter sp.]|nr:NAD(+) synthase [Agriterribacter sp.]
MRIALAQQNYHIGNFERNTEKIISAVERAKKEGAELVVFSELCVCGYPPRDFLEFDDFINRCYASIDAIKQHTEGIGVVIGAPHKNLDAPGKELFNAAWLLYNREVLGISHKTLLPTYDVFDENRYFESAFEWNIISFKGHRIALTVCEDIWNLGDNPLYRICPMDILAKQQPGLMINISASPFDYDHDEDRREVIKANVLKYGLPLVYCNAVGSQTEIVFDGGSLVYDAKGRLLKELPCFEEAFWVMDVDTGTHQPVQQGRYTDSPPAIISGETDKEMRVAKISDPERVMDFLTDTNNIRQIHQALILGIQDYFSKMGFSKALLGSSGGIDSAVALALACEALGAENVRAVLMPSPFSTGHSVKDAEQLSNNLGNPYDIIPIEAIYNSFLTSLGPLFKDLPFGVAEENIQSRTRGNLLMAIANKFGYILLNTSNKSELATGYGTLYGDMAG